MISPPDLWPVFDEETGHEVPGQYSYVKVRTSKSTTGTETPPPPPLYVFGHPVKGVRRFVSGDAPMTVNEARELEGLPLSDDGSVYVDTLRCVRRFANGKRCSHNALPKSLYCQKHRVADVVDYIAADEPDMAMGDDYPVLSPTAWYWTWRIAAVLGIWAAWAGGVWWYSSWV